jgi:hypothetical protein
MQAPSPVPNMVQGKRQITNKLQWPKSNWPEKGIYFIDNWRLGLIWDLELDIWNLVA